jgi:hypothetical protein
MMRLVIVLVVLAAPIRARADSSSAADLAGAQQRANELQKRVGHEVTIRQSCAASDGGFVAFTYDADGHYAAAVARCDARATCAIIASWRDIHSCDDGMCDHFSEVDSLSVASLADVDHDGQPDTLLDFSTVVGDQGDEHHRLVLWQSKSRKLRELGTVPGGIEGVEMSSTLIAVTTRDRSNFGTGEPVRDCFDRRGPTKCTK